MSVRVCVYACVRVYIFSVCLSRVRICLLFLRRRFSTYDFFALLVSHTGRRASFREAHYAIRHVAFPFANGEFLSRNFRSREKTGRSQARRARRANWRSSFLFFFCFFFCTQRALRLSQCTTSNLSARRASLSSRERVKHVVVFAYELRDDVTVRSSHMERVIAELRDVFN